ncbi:hypothetical protein L2E82_37665 [Cichorium intybus]|uniref:Uncharacterized protein n=1 Tax=Cichorium intybus TaxID=13427 RepID=A0ACB9AF71_CICIN|nr:hypothetical protein L2E82_37665 [Cichorium intybus]
MVEKKNVTVTTEAQSHRFIGPPPQPWLPFVHSDVIVDFSKQSGVLPSISKVGRIGSSIAMLSVLPVKMAIGSHMVAQQGAIEASSKFGADEAKMSGDTATLQGESSKELILELKTETSSIDASANTSSTREAGQYEELSLSNAGDLENE